MRLPKRGERGFTLIELLIVVAILGVLAAVVIPNIQRFIGAGTAEAQDTEFSTIQASVHAMMVDNGIATLPDPVDPATATDNMGAFPDTSPVGPAGSPGLKDYDVEGVAYTTGTPGDKIGYYLYQHDRIANGTDTELTNYTATRTTASFYTVDENGTITQWESSDTSGTPLNP